MIGAPARPSGSAPPRRAGRSWRCAAALAFTTVACGDAATPVASEPTPAVTDTSAGFRAQAHLEAYARLQPLARRAFELADPVAEAMLADTPPRPRPFSVGARAALRKAVDAAWIEAAEIDGALLPEESAAVLRAIRFGLTRLRDEHQRRPATRSDPAVGLWAITALLDEIEFRGGDCADCDTALGAAAVELDAALADLGATTVPRARAAAADCELLRARLERWRAGRPQGEALAGAAALDGALTRGQTRLTEIAAALPQAAAVTDPERVRVARAPGDVARAPERLGTAGLRRWLDVHESEARAAKTLFEALEPAARQLGALRPAPGAAATPSAVDTARCEAAWAPLARHAATMPVLVARFDCARELGRLPALADDDELQRALVVAGIVEPTRRRTRSTTEPLLARVGGDLAPIAHRHALSLAVLSGAKLAGARARAAELAYVEVCTSLAALWIHGEIGDDAALTERLASTCPGQPAPALVEAALARPERALGGLGLALLAMGPADVVALERLWWLPLGLVIDTARPPKTADTPVETKVEPLVPGKAEP